MIDEFNLNVEEMRKASAMIIQMDYPVTFQPMENVRLMNVISRFHEILPPIKEMFSKYAEYLRNWLKNEQDEDEKGRVLLNIFHSMRMLYGCSMDARNFGVGTCPMCEQTGDSQFLGIHVSEHENFIRFLAQIA